MPSYKYVLTPELLAKSLNQFVHSVGTNGELAWTKSSDIAVGWTDFIDDLKRTVMLNHGRLTTEALSLLEGISESKTEDAWATLAELADNVQVLLNADASDLEQRRQIEGLLLHYSQAPFIFVGSSPNYFFQQRDHSLHVAAPYQEKNNNNDDDLSSPAKSLPSELLIDIYMDRGKVNLRVHIDRLPIIDTNSLTKDNKAKTLFYLEGPLEGHFTLDLVKGFVLKEVSTDSKFLADLYMKDSPELFLLLNKLQLIEESLERKNEEFDKKICDQPAIISELMLEKRPIELVLSGLQDYRDRNINLETLIARVKSSGVMMDDFNPHFSTLNFKPLLEILTQLKPDNNPLERLQEVKEPHSTFMQKRQNEILESRDPIPFHFLEAKGLMKIACDSAIEIVSRFLKDHPERYGGGMFSNYMMWGASEHEGARKLAKAAYAVFPDREKGQESSDLDLLRNYVKFVKTLDEVIKELDGESKLLGEINKDDLFAVTLRSLGVLLWEKLDPQTVSTIQLSLTEHLEWMESILPEKQLTMKGRIQ